MIFRLMVFVLLVFFFVPFVLLPSFVGQAMSRQRRSWSWPHRGHTRRGELSGGIAALLLHIPRVLRLTNRFINRGLPGRRECRMLRATWKADAFADHNLQPAAQARVHPKARIDVTIRWHI